MPPLVTLCYSLSMRMYRLGRNGCTIQCNVCKYVKRGGTPDAKQSDVAYYQKHSFDST